MKKKLVIVLFTASLFTMAAIAASGRYDRKKQPPGQSPRSKQILNVGERLNYEVSYSSLVVAGEMVIDVKPGKRINGIDTVLLSALGESVGIANLIGPKVKELHESYIDPITLGPVEVNRHSTRGKKQDETQISFDRSKKLATWNDGRMCNITDSSYDMLSFLFAVRSLDLKQGRPQTLTVVDKGKAYPVVVVQEGKQKVYLRAATHEANRIAVKYINGNVNEDSYNIRLYLTDDSRRIPLLITAQPPVGQFRLELTSSSHFGGEK